MAEVSLEDVVESLRRLLIEHPTLLNEFSPLKKAELPSDRTTLDVLLVNLRYAEKFARQQEMYDVISAEVDGIAGHGSKKTQKKGLLAQIFTGDSKLDVPKVMRRAQSAEDVVDKSNGSTSIASIGRPKSPRPGERASIDQQRGDEIQRPKSPGPRGGTANRQQLNKLVGFFGPESEDAVGDLINQLGGPPDTLPSSKRNSEVLSGTDLKRQSSDASVMEAAKTRSNDRRTAKLAKFFGVKETEKGVNQLRDELRSQSKRIEYYRGCIGEKILRVYYVEDGGPVYKSLLINKSTTAAEVVKALLRKLGLSDNASDYGLFEVPPLPTVGTMSPGMMFAEVEEKRLSDTTSPLDAVASWKGEKYRLRLKRNDDHTPFYSKDNERKSAMKLAEFFGTPTGNTLKIMLDRLEPSGTFFELPKQKQRALHGPAADSSKSKDSQASTTFSSFIKSKQGDATLMGLRVSLPDKSTKEIMLPPASVALVVIDLMCSRLKVSSGDLFVVSKDGTERQLAVEEQPGKVLDASPSSTLLFKPGPPGTRSVASAIRVREEEEEEEIDDFDELYSVEGTVEVSLPDGTVTNVDITGKINANMLVDKLVEQKRITGSKLHLLEVRETSPGKFTERILSPDELPLIIQINWTTKARFAVRVATDQEAPTWFFSETQDAKIKTLNRSRANSKGASAFATSMVSKAKHEEDDRFSKRTSFAIIRESYMHFRQDYDDVSKGSWIKCFVSLENIALSVHNPISKEEVLSTIFLFRATVEELPSSTHPGKFAFRIKETVGEEQPLSFEFAADSEEERATWVKILTMTSALFNKSQKSPVILSRKKAVPATQKGLEDFEFLKVIGRGHFGKVLLCSEKVTGQVYAIKVLKKSKFVNEKDVDHIRTEQRVLRGLHHPFIVALHYAFQSEDRLYLVMEYVNGGELYYHISQEGSFEESRAKFYAAEILMGLHHLHRLGIVYRDLKLENILLNGEGHIKITDFGLCKDELGVGVMTSTICGTTEYMAPEALLSLQYGFPVDWWSYGVVLYEMLCGVHPFYSENRDELFQNILNLELTYPNWISKEACHILDRLLQRNPAVRLGSGPDDGNEIRKHPFFKSIDFDKLLRLEIPPPFKPSVSSDADASNFDDEFTQEPAILTPMEKSHLQNVPNFDNFSYDSSQSHLKRSEW